MTPNAFVEKWSKVALSERAAAQSHFIDLCHLLDEQTPTEADKKGEWYAFERGAHKTTDRDGWADVWKRGVFAWEYKRAGSNLTKAYAQLQQYAPALENPPLLIVSDIQRIIVHTNWTNTVSITRLIHLRDLNDPSVRLLLKYALSDPEKLRPDQTRETLTEEAAGDFSRLATALRDRGTSPEKVAHFINRLVFCMFAQEIGLLKEGLFTKLIETSVERPHDFVELAQDLFEAMRTGGRVGFERVRWFNGGLFDDNTALALTREELKVVLEASRKSWADIDPSIFGTLFERGLDPDKRAQLGKFYTDREKIERIVDPVIVRPLRAEWEVAKQKIQTAVERAAKARDQSAKRRDMAEAQAIYSAFLNHIRTFKVLDPACGSGNFLYVALLALKDLEHDVGLDAEAISPQLQRQMPGVGPENLYGIEVNSYAADLARVTVWIGEIQWMQKRGWGVPGNPVLRPLQNIVCADALLTEDRSAEATWPQADVVISNPPFLGCKMMFRRLGVEYTDALRKTFEDRVSPFADLVCFWFEKAGALIKSRALQRAGLVATNSIRGGKNRLVLDRIADHATIYEAWSDEAWVVEGAAVRVSLACIAAPSDPIARTRTLDGKAVESIYPDLTGSKRDGSGADVTKAARLAENAGVAFVGTVKAGAFDVSGELARKWLLAPANPNAHVNSDVLRPWANGIDVVRRPQDKWIIDFGVDGSMEDAALYEAPFRHVKQYVQPERAKVRRERYRKFWWLQAEPCAGMRKAISSLSRFIATPAMAKHRVFSWMDGSVQPDHQLIVIARDDDVTFGILSSRFHRVWSLKLCTWLGVGNDPRYTPSTTFETFPFPDGMTPSVWTASLRRNPAAREIAAAAKRLAELREQWLNPTGSVRRIPEVAPGYPDRVVPIDEEAARLLRTRTLTNLYNEMPTWLSNAHLSLDRAVAVAYGFSEDISDDEIASNLLELNRERAERPAPSAKQILDRQGPLILPIDGQQRRQVKPTYASVNSPLRIAAEDGIPYVDEAGRKKRKVKTQKPSDRRQGNLKLPLKGDLSAGRVRGSPRHSPVQDKTKRR